MNTKQKAVELVAKFTGLVECEIAGKNGFEFSKDMQVDNAKICAKIVVDEIIRDNPNIYDSDRLNWKYWTAVKLEIEKL